MITEIAQSRMDGSDENVVKPMYYDSKLMYLIRFTTFIVYYFCIPLF
jgi:hypothetical protein